MSSPQYISATQEKRRLDQLRRALAALVFALLAPAVFAQPAPSPSGPPPSGTGTPDAEVTAVPTLSYYGTIALGAVLVYLVMRHRRKLNTET